MRNILFLIPLLCGTAIGQCTYSLNPTSFQASASGGSSDTVTMTVVSGQSCTRSVTSNASWITVTFGATGTGNGSFGFTVDPNTGSAGRTGTITAAGQTFTVTQAAPTVTLMPTSASFTASGGTGTFSLTSNSNWAATSTVTWIHITANPTGVAPSGQVSYSVDANPTTTARVGAIQVGTGTLTVNQAGLTCTATLSAASTSVNASGTTGSFTVTSITQGCTISALSNVSWIKTFINTTTNTVTYNVSANTSTANRTGLITVADKTFTITQDGQTTVCTFTLSTNSASYPAAGGNGTVGVTTAAGCAWTAAANADWLKVVSGSGPGPGVVAYNVAANNTPAARTGTFTIGGIAFTITQTAPDANAVLVTAVRNVASYQGSAVAPGEFVVIFGTNIGPAAYTFQSVTDNRFGTLTAGTRVLFDGEAAPLYYVGVNQSAAIVPYSIYGKTQTKLQVEYQGVKSNEFTLDVTDAVPGIFTQSQSGTGAGSILNQDYSVNTAANPAPRGSIVSVYATGEGQTNPAGSDGLLATGSTLPAPLLKVTATVGGVPAAVQYAGAAPSLVAGVLQVNVTIPDTTPSGNAILIIQVGTKQSQAGVTVAVQ